MKYSRNKMSEFVGKEFSGEKLLKAQLVYGHQQLGLKYVIDASVTKRITSRYGDYMKREEILIPITLDPSATYKVDIFRHCDRGMNAWYLGLSGSSIIKQAKTEVEDDVS